MGRNRRSTLSAGEPRTWGRAVVLTVVLVPKDEGTRPLNNVKQEQTHLAKLAASDPDKRFHRLYRLICQPEWLRSALDAIRANKGFNTPGTDGVRGEDLDRNQIEQLAEKLRAGTYQPTPVRRIYIPKRTGKLRPLGLPIWVSYCLSFQAMFGMPRVANWVDQKLQSTFLILLYHVLPRFATLTTFPMSLRWLAQPLDDLFCEGDPARAMRVSTNAFQNPSVTPLGYGRDVNVEPFGCRQGGVAPIASLSGWAKSRSLWAIEGNMIGGTNPVHFAGSKAASHPWSQPLLIEQVSDLGCCMGRSQLLQASDDLLIGLTDFPRLFETRNGQVRLCLRLPANIDLNEVAALGKRHIFDQPAQKLLALGVGRGRSLPKSRQVRSQGADLLSLLSRERESCWFGQHVIFPFEPIHLQQLFIPVPFQTARHQAIFWVHSHIAAASQIRFMTSARSICRRAC